MLAGYVIPPSSGKLLAFEDKYIEKHSIDNAHNVQMKVNPETVLYIETYRQNNNQGYRASLEHFEGKKLTMRLTAIIGIWKTTSDAISTVYTNTLREGVD